MSEPSPVIDRGALPKLKQAKRRLWAGLMAVKPKLDEPYPDDARWTPWTRFVGPRLDELWAAFDELLLAAGRSAMPVGDSGLREALEQLAADWRSLPRDESSVATTVLRHCGAQLRGALDAHPAAPAVPQPVDREALHDKISAAITKAVAEYRGYLVFDGLGTVAADAVLAVLAEPEAASDSESR